MQEYVHLNHPVYIQFAACRLLFVSVGQLVGHSYCIGSVFHVETSDVNNM